MSSTLITHLDHNGQAQIKLTDTSNATQISASDPINVKIDNHQLIIQSQNTNSNLTVSLFNSNTGGFSVSNNGINFSCNGLNFSNQNHVNISCNNNCVIINGVEYQPIKPISTSEVEYKKEWQIDNPIKLESINVSGSGKCSVISDSILNHDQLTCNVSGSGRALFGQSLYGTTLFRHLNINLSGSGQIESTSEALSTICNLTGSGQIKLKTILDRFCGTVTGSGTIRFTHNHKCQINRNITGSGQIIESN